MKPNKEGIWEWYDSHGVRRLVEVVNVGYPPNVYLRVYFWGGYYNINDEGDDSPAEWADRWGNYVGEYDKKNVKDYYLLPTEEEIHLIKSMRQ